MQRVTTYIISYGVLTPISRLVLEQAIESYLDLIGSAYPHLLADGDAGSSDGR